MADYYIRTPEQDESRGPFDISKLLTLAEAGQVTPNTLYYDEETEEWVPIALNEKLNAAVFLEREKLSLQVEEEAKPEVETKDPGGINVESMLAAAEGETAEKKKLTRQKKSFERAATISAVGLGLMMLFSALFMILPLMPVLQSAIGDQQFATIFNHPAALIGGFDLTMAILILLSVTEVYPLVRGRAMLGLGFGVYVGWSLGDPILMGVSAAAGVGIFLATISQSLNSMIAAFILGIGGNLYLAYLALNGRFDGFFESIVFNWIAS